MPPFVVPYIGTWIETDNAIKLSGLEVVVPYIGTWIETVFCDEESIVMGSRTLYRYVD